MDFALTETQLEIKDLTARILLDYTGQEQLRELDNTGYFSKALWAQLAEAGLLGVAIDESCGGMGFNFETLCVVLEEIGRRVAPVPAVGVLAGAVMPLQKRVNTPQVAELLAQVATGELLLTSATLEPFNGPQASLQTRAEQQGGQWQLNGTKVQVVAAAAAGYCWVSAATPASTAVFLVALNATGVSVTPETMTNGEVSGIVRFNQTPATLLLEGAEAVEFLELAENYAVIGTAAQSNGLCDEMIRLAAEYTTERVQFGKAIGSFQAVAHQLADCYIDAQCLRGVTEQAVCRLDETDVDSAAIKEAALVAGYWTSEALLRISQRTQQVHGGAGVDRDYPLFRYCLNARKNQLAFGGSSPLTQRLGQLLVAGAA